MKVALFASALFAAVGAQPGEPWPGPFVYLYGTDMYNSTHEFRAPDNGPPIHIIRIAPIKSAYIGSPEGATCTILGRESTWYLAEGEELIVEPPEHFVYVWCRSPEE